MKVGEMGGAYSMHERDQKCIHTFREETVCDT